MGFWKNYGIGTLKGIEKSGKELLVGADIEGFSAAAIATQLEVLDAMSIKQAAAEKKVEKEVGEAVAIVQLQQDRLDGIEVLQAENAATTDAKVHELNNSVIIAELDKLDAMQEDIAREKEEAEEAKVDLAEIREVVALAKEKLDMMQKGLEKVKTGMSKAKLAVVRNEERAAIAEEKAGLRAPDDTFNTIMAAANSRLEAIQNKGRAAEIKADALTKKDNTSDVMKAAMAKAKGVAPVATMSVEERLAALKGK